MNLKIQFPSIENVEKLRAEILCKPRHEILIFNYTDIYDSHGIIIEIYDTLQKLDIGTTLVLIGYSLLTHLSIELLYLISCAFNSLAITICNDVGLKIILYHYNYNPKVLKFFNEINAASSEAQKQERAILEIISPSVFYEGKKNYINSFQLQFYNITSHIIFFLGCCLSYSAEYLNYWIIKTYFHHVLDTLKKVEKKS